MSKILPITTDEDRHRILQVRESIFSYQNLGEIYFTPTIASRAILYPIGPGPLLNRTEVNALAKVAQVVADESVYFSLLERAAESDHIEDWLLPINNIKSYLDFRSPHMVLENALYSPRGTWGIGMTVDEFAVIGGSPKFLESFLTELEKDPDEMTRAFINNTLRNESCDPAWLKAFLVNFYGKARGLQYFS